MDWPFPFPRDVPPEHTHLRRQSLDYYGQLSHLSSLAPLFVAILVRVTTNVLSYSPSAPRPGTRTSHHDYHEVPGSPFAKARRAGAAGRWKTNLRRLRWWITDDVVIAGTPRGRRDEWILGLAWTLWSLILCFHGTGGDYIHLTKRLGIVAIAQLPAHYLLSLRPLNPYSWAFRCSHEHVNRYHRLLGAVTCLLLLAHVLLFNNFFLQLSQWLARLARPAVLLGHLLATLLLALAATSLPARVRRYSYRVFFVVHVAAAAALPALVFLHAPAARLYAAEALVALALDLAARRLTTFSARPLALDIIPGTSLVRVILPLPAHRARLFRALPAAHIYLSIPSSSPSSASSSSARGAALIFRLLFNPFTVAAVGDDSITLIARQRNGPLTTALACLAATPPPSSSSGPKNSSLPAPANALSLAVEGPYGTMAKSYPSLLAARPDRVLLLAGGVGASFAVPLHRALSHDLPCATVRLVWAVRARQDAAWSLAPAGAPSTARDRDRGSGSGSGSGPDIEPADDRIQLYITGKRGPRRAATMTTTTTTAAAAAHIAELHDARPDIPQIVDDTFRRGYEERVAVLVCGPAGMASEVRAQVRPWVMRGRDVWFHSESFAW
ncbi:Ferric/cupric reductase transmembrane component 2 [Escovopsis weberi]|uniref:Ferric/cupric reductase transmembrane component 2 n=1 Tax=Escovopsis weberi TaxID=150374 RepID=A0A0M8MT38_ESCWE|nr:Ferric/cupric reductase transmembrane component 2 [Escovopsis weberi]